MMTPDNFHGLPVSYILRSTVRIDGKKYALMRHISKDISEDETVLGMIKKMNEQEIREKYENATGPIEHEVVQWVEFPTDDDEEKVDD
jgi:hypothetical protein